MRIGVLFRPDAPNAFYRAINPAEALSAKGHHVVVVQQGEDYRFDPKPLHRCDVVHVYRRGDPIVMAAVDELQQRGIAVTWDNDDDIRLLPAGSSPLAKKMSKIDVKKDFEMQKRMLRRADLVTTTSPHLERTYRELTDSPVHRIENYLGEAQYPRGPRRHEGLVIGWIAGLEHHADDQALRISATLKRVLDRHADVRVVSVGVRLALPQERYHHDPLLPFPELCDRIRQFDLAIAPLADIPMSYARSNVKVKEYAAAGIPWLASARGPYEGLGEQQGGILVADDSWEEALESLVGSGFKRWRLGRRAKSWAASQALKHHVGRWESVFEEAVALASSKRADPAAVVRGARRRSARA